MGPVADHVVDTDPAALTAVRDDTYETTFDNGSSFRLLDRRGTFRVSLAGLALGNHLIRDVREHELSGRILEVGTGSGVLTMLLRELGARSITATDIAASAVVTAEHNEHANFGDSVVDFRHADLFPDPGPDGDDRYDLVVFNPPGWRTPSPALREALEGKERALDLEAMFYGDAVLLRFLEQLPRHLAPGGRALVGFNSLIGIDDILARAGSEHGTSVHRRLLERIEFPLFFYTDEWVEVRNSLLSEFERCRDEFDATFVERDGAVHWYYEITEITAAGGFGRLPGITPLPLQATGEMHP